MPNFILASYKKNKNLLIKQSIVYAFHFSFHAPNILYENLGTPTQNTFKM